MLSIVRTYHGVVRATLAMPEPDRARAEQYMRLARKTGRQVAPFLCDWDLRQRIVADEPWPEEEWERFYKALRVDPSQFYLRLA